MSKELEIKEERLNNLRWFGEIKVIFLKRGYNNNEELDDIMEEIYQATKKHYKKEINNDG